MNTNTPSETPADDHSMSINTNAAESTAGCEGKDNLTAQADDRHLNEYVDLDPLADRVDEITAESDPDRPIRALPGDEDDDDVVLVLDFGDGFERIDGISPDAAYHLIGELEYAVDIAAVTGDSGGESDV